MQPLRSLVIGASQQHHLLNHSCIRKTTPNDIDKAIKSDSMPKTSIQKGHLRTTILVTKIDEEQQCFSFSYLFYTMNEVTNKQIYQNYREKPKTFMKNPYFCYGPNMVKTAVENRTLNLPRKSGQQASHFHNSKYISPKILKFHQRIENSMIYNFGIIHFCIRDQQYGLMQV